MISSLCLLAVVALAEVRRDKCVSNQLPEKLSVCYQMSTMVTLSISKLRDKEFATDVMELEVQILQQFEFVLVAREEV